MRCSACGVENRPGARFCNGCGAALAAACASCGQSNPPGSRFCDACGQPLTAATRTVEPTLSVAPAAPAGRSPASPHLLASDALEAQRLLDGAIKGMMDAVHRYEGTVSRLMGDGLMALFGAPVAHEDHAVRACYAALAMQDGVRRHAGQVRRVH